MRLGTGRRGRGLWPAVVALVVLALFCGAGGVVLSGGSATPAVDGWLARLPAPIVPAAAARESIPCVEPASDPDNFRFLGVRPWAGGGRVTFQTMLCGTNQQDDAPFEMFGYFLMSREGLLWRATGGGSSNISMGDPKGPVWWAFGSQTGPRQRGERTFLYGRVLELGVEAVEVRYNDGRIGRDDASSGYFALLPPDPAFPCELRVIGEGEKELARIDLSSSPEAIGGRPLPPGACKP